MQEIKLSKSRFVAGCQCLKRLYLPVREPELAAEPDAAAEAIIEQGREVGLLARKLCPGGIEVCSAGLDQAIRTTRELVANPEVPVIFEGVFEHDGVLVRVDVLQRRKENLWRLLGFSVLERWNHEMDSPLEAGGMATQGQRFFKKAGDQEPGFLWEQIDRLQALQDVRWEWTKGHSTDEDNNRCDALANASARLLADPARVREISGG